MPKIRFILSTGEIEAEVPEEYSILQAAAAAGVPFEGDCGGKGTCGKCRIKILSGIRGMPTPVEKESLPADKITGGWALACQRHVEDGMIVEVREQGELRQDKARMLGRISREELDPPVEKFFVTMPSPSADDQTPDLERLLGLLPGDNLRVSPGVLATLPGVLRRSGFQVTAALVGGRLVAVEPGDTTRRKFGLAIDIGTTTLAVYLLDLNNGNLLSASSRTNPQKVLGADVISRINHAARGAAQLKQLQEMVLGALNEIIGGLLTKNQVKEAEVYEAVAVGNTTMNHLFLGIDPTNLALTPFIPVFRNSIQVRAGELGLRIHPEGRVLVLPNIAGYVGSDTVGVMLATGIDRRENICLAVDIGTNGEVVLAGPGLILTCSTAAGPAFEGSHIKHGMRAAEGAIEAVNIDGEISFKVIGGTAPRGICGSGLIDAVAGMLGSGIINSSGRLADPEKNSGVIEPRLKSRLREGANCREFLLVPGSFTATGEDIVITQKDLRELQLAKGAILAGIRILLKEARLSPGDINEVFLAGAFGNHIRIESALAIGLLPDVARERIMPVGNAAGDGAVRALVSRAERARALTLPAVSKHVELSARKDFQEEFIKSVYFSKNG